MLKKLGVNVVWCVAFLLVSGLLGNGSIFAQGGVDSYTKLMIHADGSDQGTSFTDSSSGAKTVTNTETYDSYTKLMLHMNGSGGSTTFTDSATSNSVTVNGTAQIDTAQSKFGGASGLFASSDHLTLADSNDWDFGSGDFTIDVWIKMNFSGVRPIVNQVGTNGSQYAWSLHIIDNEVAFYYSIDGTNQVQVARGSVDTSNVWHHVAVTRNGANARVFFDGVQIGTTHNIGTATIYNSTSLVYVGYLANTYAYVGNMDEVRISKGIARWTSDFTPPSSPYGKVATVTSQKKFGTASGEFKGSGEYLSLADSDDWNFGTGDFTIDFWVRFNAIGIYQQLYCQYVSTPIDVQLYLNDSNTLRFLARNTSTIADYQYNWSNVNTNTWYHIAVVRNGTLLKMYINGADISATEVTAISANSLPNVADALYIGKHQANVNWVNGYLDELRISKGIARWTSNFTPPSAPYETDTTPPTVSSTSPTSNATGVGVSSAISATFSEDMDSSTITTSTFTLSSSSGSVSGTVSYSNKVATFTPSSSLSYSTTYTATITTGVKDAGGNAMSSTYTWSFTTSSAPDTTAPTGSVSGASYTNSSTVTLTLSATDNVGVTGYYLSDSSTTPSVSASGWTSITSTTSYSGTVSYSLSGGEGSKTIYTWYKDAAGNVSSTASATITLDTTVPTVTISSPTTSSTYTSTTSTISLGGSASDSVSGISSVSWSNNRGGNGTATGTASWTASSISLSSGDNVITVTAKDGAGNSGTDTLQVTYGTSSTVSAPTASTGSASNVTTSSATLNGTVNANGASTTAWFQYGSTSGSYGNTSSTQTVTGSSNTTVSIGISGLSSNTKYYYRIAASNSGGTSYGSETSFTTSTASATPTPTPTPTAAPTATPTPKPTPTAQPTPTRPPTLPPLPTPQPSPSPAQEGVVFGSVDDQDEQPLEGVTVTITGHENQVTETDENGYYEFSGLAKGSYTLTYEKDGYQTKMKSITLEEGEEKDLGITVLEEEGDLGKIYGYVVDIKGDPIESVRLKLKGLKTGVKSTETSDGDGFFEFADLGADKYILTAQKKRYRKSKQTITLEEGESREIEIEMRKTSKRIIDERQTTEGQKKMGK